MPLSSKELRLDLATRSAPVNVQILPCPCGPLLAGQISMIVSLSAGTHYSDAALSYYGLQRHVPLERVGLQHHVLLGRVGPQRHVLLERVGPQRHVLRERFVPVAHSR